MKDLNKKELHSTIVIDQQDDLINIRKNIRRVNDIGTIDQVHNIQTENNPSQTSSRIDLRNNKMDYSSSNNIM